MFALRFGGVQLASSLSVGWLCASVALDAPLPRSCSDDDRGCSETAATGKKQDGRTSSACKSWLAILPVLLQPDWLLLFLMPGPRPATPLHLGRAQYMHVVAQPRFYYFHRVAHDAAFRYNFQAMGMATLLVVVLVCAAPREHSRHTAGSGGGERRRLPGRLLWQAWLASRELLCTLSTLHTRSIMMPLTVLATPCSEWHRLPSFQFLYSTMMAPLWDTLLNTMMDDGLRVRALCRICTRPTTLTGHATAGACRHQRSSAPRCACPSGIRCIAAT